MGSQAQLCLSAFVQDCERDHNVAPSAQAVSEQLTMNQCSMQYGDGSARHLVLLCCILMMMRLAIHSLDRPEGLLTFGQANKRGMNCVGGGPRLRVSHSQSTARHHGEQEGPTEGGGWLGSAYARCVER